MALAPYWAMVTFIGLVATNIYAHSKIEDPESKRRAKNLLSAVIAVSMVGLIVMML